MVKLRLLTIILAVTLSVVAKADNEQDDGGRTIQSSPLIPSPRNDTDRTINALFSDINIIPSNGDLWDRIRQGFSMPDLDVAQVAEQERYYSQHPEYINRIVNRGSRYLYYVASEIQKRGMPMELALLPIVESAYNPRAESPARASGMWQFIPSTGKLYGLERTWWYDGRRDVVAATDAALNYLQKLYEIFGDWPLALAAYNWGDGSVKRAQAKNEARGLPTDYTAINMPNETRNYVPKLIAIRNIIANPLAYGIKLAMIPDKPYFTTLEPEKHMDVTVAAKLAEISVEELLNLNPGYIRPVIAYKEERKLVLPVNKVETFKKNLAAYDKPLLNWQPYTTKRGESFDKLARQYNISVAELRAINNLSDNTVTTRGQTILVPIQHDVSQSTLSASAAKQQGNLIERSASADQASTSIPADTDIPGKMVAGNTIQESGTSLQVKDFHLLNPKVTAQKMAVLERAQTRPKTQRYEVKRGDTLYSIAQRFNTSAEDLAGTNRLRNSQIHAGQVLVIPQ